MDGVSRRKAFGGAADTKSRCGTVISVVLPDREEGGINQGQGGGANSNTGLSKFIFVKTCGYIYGMMLIVFGFVLPLLEALKSSWLNYRASAGLLTYITAVGSLSLIYLQFDVLRHLQNRIINFFKNLKLCKRNSAAVASATGDTVTVGHTAAGTLPAEQQSTNINSAEQISHLANNLNSAQTITSPVYTKRVQRPNVPYNDKMGMPIEAEHNVADAVDYDIGDDDSVGDAFDLTSEQESNESTVEWVDLSQFGNIFSHEGSSLYLQLGALVFGLGNVVYCVLAIHSTYGATMGDADQSCASLYPHSWTYIPHLIFVVLQTFFLFKGSQVAGITNNQDNKGGTILVWSMTWLSLVHVLSTNICLWLRTLINEIMIEFLRSAYNSPDGETEHRGSEDSGKGHAVHDLITKVMGQSIGAAVAKVVNDTKVHPFVLPAINDSSSSSFSLESSEELETEPTIAPTNCDALISFSSFYLFPLILEFSLIAIGTYTYILLDSKLSRDKQDVTSNIKNVIKVFLMSAVEQEEGKDKLVEHGHEHNSETFAKSHIGIFSGIILLSFALVAIVLFNVYYKSNQNLSEMFFLATDIALHACMMLACAASFWFMRPLAYVAKPLATDDMLLLIALIGSVVYETVVIVPLIDYVSGPANVGNESLRLASSLISCAQSVMQSVLALYALRRYPIKHAHTSNMPGRGCLAFLVISNIAVWLLRTVLYKKIELVVLLEHYGNISWLLLMNINYPLLLFFRFHSSVCFADAWHVAYHPISTKLKKTKHTDVPEAHTEGVVEVGSGRNPDNLDAISVFISMSGVTPSHSMSNHNPQSFDAISLRSRMPDWNTLHPSIGQRRHGGLQGAPRGLRRSSSCCSLRPREKSTTSPSKTAPDGVSETNNLSSNQPKNWAGQSDESQKIQNVDKAPSGNLVFTNCQNSAPIFMKNLSCEKSGQKEKQNDRDVTEMAQRGNDSIPSIYVDSSFTQIAPVGDVEE